MYLQNIHILIFEHPLLGFTVYLSLALLLPITKNKKKKQQKRNESTERNERKDQVPYLN